MDVLTSETCSALNKVIIKQVASRWSLFTQLLYLISLKSGTRCGSGNSWHKAWECLLFKERHMLFHWVKSKQGMCQKYKVILWHTYQVVTISTSRSRQTTATRGSIIELQHAATVFAFSLLTAARPQVEIQWLVAVEAHWALYRECFVARLKRIIFQ